MLLPFQDGKVKNYLQRNFPNLDEAEASNKSGNAGPVEPVTIQVVNEEEQAAATASKAGNQRLAMGEGSSTSNEIGGETSGAAKKADCNMSCSTQYFR